MNPLSYPLAVLATVLLVRVLMRMAGHMGLLDQPGWRKGHAVAVPAVGGLAIFLAFIFGLLISGAPLGSLRAYATAAGLIVVVGFLDDMQELPSSSRFGVQIVAALLMVYWGGLRLHSLGHLISTDTPVTLVFWSAPLSVFAVVGVINAVNMIDGMDGLAGGVSLVVLLALMFLAGPESGLTFHTLLLLSLVLAVFLFYNLPRGASGRARIFLGDAGSMFLGFTIAWYLVTLSQGEGAVMEPVTALWILGLPLIDTVSIMLRRILRGRSPFAADREHMHHLLLALGIRVQYALLILLLLAAIFAAVGIAGQRLGVPGPVMFGAFLGLFASYFLLSLRLWRSGRFLGHQLERRSGRERRQGADPAYRGSERRAGSRRAAKMPAKTPEGSSE